jgi:hypothetical protein
MVQLADSGKKTKEHSRLDEGVAVLVELDLVTFGGEFLEYDGILKVARIAVEFLVVAVDLASLLTRVCNGVLAHRVVATYDGHAESRAATAASVKRGSSRSGHHADPRSTGLSRQRFRKGLGMGHGAPDPAINGVIIQADALILHLSSGAPRRDRKKGGRI